MAINDYVPAEYGGYILKGIPKYTEADAGKALKVDQDGVGIGWHEDIYDNTENLLRNGKPTFSMTQDTDISTAAGLGSWVSWSLSRGSNTNAFEWGDGIPYFHFTYEASKTASQSVMQLQKIHRLNNVPGVSGKELESLIPGAAVTLSFEFKSDIPINLRSRMDATDQSGTRVMRILNIDRNFESAVSDWTEITVSDVIPYNFKEIFLSENAKNAYLLISTKFIDDNHRSNGNIYLRNIKLQYGRSATPFTYSDIDVRMIDAARGPYVPGFSTADAGKVLSVNEGGTGVEWAQAADGIYWITATETDVGGGTYLISLNKTFLEIYTAMQNRFLCIVEYSIMPGPPNYHTYHDVVNHVGYDSVVEQAYCVYAGNMVYKATTINDYPVEVN